MLQASIYLGVIYTVGHINRNTYNSNMANGKVKLKTVALKWEIYKLGNLVELNINHNYFW